MHILFIVSVIIATLILSFFAWNGFKNYKSDKILILSVLCIFTCAIICLTCFLEVNTRFFNSLPDNVETTGSSGVIDETNLYLSKKGRNKEIGAYLLGTENSFVKVKFDNGVYLIDIYNKDGSTQQFVLKALELYYLIPYVTFD